jgi:glycosyltransferase family protein
MFRSEIEMFVEKYPSVLTETSTLQLIIEQKLSIARFGDGEFKLMVGERHKSFQDVDQELNRRMKEVLKSQNASLLVAIQAVRTFEQLSFIWRKFIIRIGDPVLDLLDRKREYASTGVFREIHVDDSGAFIKRIRAVKKLWEARDVVFVIGRNSRFKFEKELFNNCRSISYIYGPPKNAFSHYDELINQVRKYSKNEHLILIALGPTATVMAHDLALEGYQAIDFGQMPGQFRKARQRFFKDDELSGLEKPF